MDQSNTIPAGELTRNNSTAATRNVLETVAVTGNFTTFRACIKAAGLSDALAAKGPFTVFAPTDEAFKKLPTGAQEHLLKDTSKLKAVMNYHVVAGHYMAKELKSGEVMTLQGTTLRAVATYPDVRVNGARITQPDVAATNGIIHGIDAVILPKNWQLLAAAA